MYIAQEEEEPPIQYHGKGKAVVASSSRQKTSMSPSRSRATSIVASGTSPGPSNRKNNSAAATEQERRVQHNLRILRGLGVDVDGHQANHKDRKGKARADEVEEDQDVEDISENEGSVTEEGMKRTKDKATSLEDKDEESMHGDTHEAPSRSPSRPPRRIFTSPSPAPSQVDADGDAEGSDDDDPQPPAPKPPLRLRKNNTQDDSGEVSTPGSDEDADSEPPHSRLLTRQGSLDSSQGEVEQGRSHPPTPAPTNQTKISKGNTDTINHAKKVYSSRRQQSDVAQDSAPPPVRSSTRPPARLATGHSKSRVIGRNFDDPTQASPLEDEASSSGHTTVQHSRRGQTSRQHGNSDLAAPSDTAEPSQPSPRPSTSSQKPPVDPIAIPPGASEFTTKAADYLFGISNDNTWVRLVNLWVRFEGTLSQATGKPVCIVKFYNT